jgi:hypothetical protein
VLEMSKLEQDEIEQLLRQHPIELIHGLLMLVIVIAVLWVVTSPC